MVEPSSRAVKIDVKRAFIDGIRTVVVVDDRMRAYDEVVRASRTPEPEDSASPDEPSDRVEPIRRSGAPSPDEEAGVSQEPPDIFVEIGGESQFFAAKPRASALSVQAPRREYEDDAAAALVEDFRRRGWLYDIVNTDFQMRAMARAKSCDLIILDYMLGESANDSLNILGQLAHSQRFHLVILYTREQEELVWLNIASTLAGPPSSFAHHPFDQDDEDFRERLNKVGEPTSQDVVTFLCDGLSFPESPPTKKAKAATPTSEQLKWISTHQRVKREHAARRDVRELLHISPVSRMEASRGALKWLRCGNLFVVVQHKRRGADQGQVQPEDSAVEKPLGGDVLVDKLIKCLDEWRPSFVRRMLRFLRHRVAEQGLTTDAEILKGPVGEAALLLYSRSGSPAEQVERRRLVYTRVFERILYGLLESTDVRDALDDEFEGGDALAQAAGAVGLDAGAHREDIYFRLNWFLAFEEHFPPFLRTGTVFFLPGSDDLVGVCVTPECDLVSRERKPEAGADASKAVEEAGDSSAGSKEKSRGAKPRPAQAVLWRAARLVRGKDDAGKKQIQKGLKGAEDNYYLFISLQEEKCVILLRPSGSDKIPKPEVLFVLNDGRIDENSDFEAVRVFAGENGAPTLEATPQKFRVLGQLREAYAIKLLHEAGHQLSRVGVELVRLP